MAKVSPKKTPMREQPPKERIRNFDEVPFGYSIEEAIKEAKRCLQCKKPKCIDGCPVEIDIPGFIDFIAKNDFKNGINRLKEKNILPAICGRVCPQEEQCEIKCIVGIKNEPVAIGRLERFLADWERENEKIEIPKIPKKTGKKVVIVGAGPAGITAAADLVRWGHKVDIFEALHQPGGVLVYGIPEFRLPKSIVFKEIFLKKLTAEFQKQKINYNKIIFLEAQRKKWVVFAQKPFEKPQNVINYLGNYTHSVAISNYRIKKVENGK